MTNVILPSKVEAEAAVAGALPVSPIAGPKILLLGASGTGKTYSIRSLLAQEGIKQVRAVFTEPGMSTVGDIPPEQLAWNFVKPATTTWADSRKALKRVNDLTYKAQCESEPSDKKQFTQMLDFYDLMENYVDQRTGKNYGPVSSWGTDVALFIDGLSGLGVMAMKLATGSKLVKAPHDWGTAQGILEDLITKLTCDVFCTAVLIGHIEREVDEVTGGTTLMASAPGRKLAPKISRWFDDVVHCRRDGDKWDWSTNTTNMDLKSRHLGVHNKLPPDFTPLFETWKKAGGQFFPGSR